MTRHNLDSHIAWLLSREVTPRANVHTTIPTDSSRPVEGGVQETLNWEDDEGQEVKFISSSPRKPRTVSGVNVGHGVDDFIRPPLPTFAASTTGNPTTFPIPAGNSEGVTMVRQIPAPRSARPAVMNQFQMATPASTTSSAVPSSLTQSYRRLLSEETSGKTTPSSKVPSNRAPNTSVRALQTPQTPRQTPMQTPRPTSERMKVESVDLTGDDYSAAMSRSSSSDMVWGESEELWNEPAALRPEPLPRTSKKRKSEDISTPGCIKRTQTRNTPTRKLEREDLNVDDFVDIEDFDMPPSRSSGHLTTMKGSSLIRASIEAEGRKPGIPEELEVTETVTRTETRTRKSISRVPSVTGAVPARSSNTVQIPGTPLPGIFTDSVLRPLLSGMSSPRVRNSPSPNTNRTPEKRRARRIKNEIQDSDEDDCLSEVERIASCSPTSVKNSPRVKTRSPTIKGSPTFPSPEHKPKNFNDSKPRIGSPLRPISMNTILRQESVPSPFHQDPSTLLYLPEKPIGSQPSQHAPGSSLLVNEKQLVDMYLAEPSTISIYCKRVGNLLAQNSIASMAYIDEQLTAPSHMKEERKALLEMKKAYDDLDTLGKLYQSKKIEKLNVANRILEIVNHNGDPSEQEETSAALSRDLRSIQNDVRHLLHASGAVKDGFGTGCSSVAAHVTTYSKAHDSQAPLPSGSSSAQIIMQTQFPSLSRKETVSSSKLGTDTAGVRSPSRDRYFTASAGVYDRASPSPVRTASSALFTANRFAVHKEVKTRPQQTFKQPDFRRDKSPIPYDFDDAAFDDLLEDEQDFVESNRPRPIENAPLEIEENYGDSDFGDDIEDLVQGVEKRHSSVKVPTPTHYKQAAIPAVSRSTPGVKHSHSKQRKDMYSHVDVEKSGLLKHPWSGDVKKALKERFKLNGFRYHQLEAINATLSGQDAFILMPTGGGKSLCYQLPAIVQSGKTKGITIVISPLLSLMKDQVRHLLKLHIRAATINSETSPAQKAAIIESLREKHPEQHIQLLYVTPEMMSKSTQMLGIFTKLYNNNKLARIVIDEAHCVSQWGHDFRPDYVALSSLRKSFSGVPIMALTATATQNVQMDVTHNLGMRNCPVFAQSFNRPNLHYEVRKKKKGKPQEVLQDMAKLILEDYKGQTGIIYTLSKRNCEEIASKLYTQYKIRAFHFHAGMNPVEKSDTQEQWQSGEIQVVVATIAFGMGIDKANVRFVIHHMIPKSLEGYYQETGRAGRDGLKSGCYLFYGYADTTMLRKFIYESEASSEQKDRQRKMLQDMVQYCENRADCRRVQVLRYFNETFKKEDCGHTCDNCLSDAVFEDTDFSKYATAAVQVVKRVMTNDVTLLHCVDVLRGVQNQKVKNMEHGKIPEFGFAKDIERNEVERLFYRLIMENALEEHNVMNGSGFPVQYMRLGPNCRSFLNGQRKIMMQVQISRSPAAPIHPKQAKSSRYPTSTMLTSPLSPAVRKKKPSKHINPEESDEFDDGNDLEDFIVSDGEAYGAFEERGSSLMNAFEYMQKPKEKPPKPRQLETRGGDLGPPITSDPQIGYLPEIHQMMVQQFVTKAKELEENIRNGTSARRPFFTEANLREMAISWTLNIADMKRIPGINIDRVQSYGKQFLPLIRRFHDQYNAKMNEEEDRDIDPNHLNVIDLCSNDEEEDEEEEFDEDEGVEQQAKSQYFPSEPKRAPPTRNLPWAPDHENSLAGAKKTFPARSTFTKGRGRGNSRKGSSRKSYGSTSGVSSAGVSKRRASGGAKKQRGKASTSSSSKPSFAKYNGNSSGGRGGGNGGIGMMPT